MRPGVDSVAAALERDHTDLSAKLTGCRDSASCGTSGSRRRGRVVRRQTPQGRRRRFDSSRRLQHCRPISKCYGARTDLIGSTTTRRLGHHCIVVEVPGLDVDARRESDVVRLTVRGELDIATAPILATELAAACALDVPDLVLDFAGLTFCDSSGMREVFNTARRCIESGRRLRIVNAQPAIRRVFEMTDTADLLDDDPPTDAP